VTRRGEVVGCALSSIAGSLRIETFEGSRPHSRLMGFELDLVPPTKKNHGVSLAVAEKYELCQAGDRDLG
jgi:hypothetical protein